MNKFNVIIDFNYLAYKTLFIAKGFGKLNHPYLALTSEQGQYVRKLATDFCHDVSMFKGYDKIIVCKDSHSWRKDFFNEYKIHRKHDSEIAWDKLFQLADKFLEIIAEKGVIVSKLDGAEGDDLLYLWSKYLTLKKENCVLMTGDGDLNQIVDYDDETFIIAYNNNSSTRKFTVKQGFLETLKKSKKEIDIDDLFNMDNISLLGQDTYTVIDRLLREHDVIEIDIPEFVFNKIICGDSGDNIPSLWCWESKGKPVRLTNKHFVKLLEMMKEKYGVIDILRIKNDGDVRNFLYESIQTVSKLSIDKQKLLENLDRNIMLGYLNVEVIPKELVTNFFNEIKNQQYKKITTNFDRIELLKDTEFEKKFDTSFESSIFSGE